MPLPKKWQPLFAGVSVTLFAALLFGFQYWFKNQSSALVLEENIFYVSPSGNDLNPGTVTAPWKTFYKASVTLQAGQTAVFEDGTYNETQQTRISTYSGTSEKPIVFRAKNPHKAVIAYQNQPGLKLHISRPFVTIQDFEITQNVKGTNTGDKLVECGYQTADCTILGNKIHNAYEECIKGADVTRMRIERNICYDTTHEGIDLVNGTDVLIKGNMIYDFGRIGIMAKGGIRNVRVVNNTVKTAKPTDIGIGLGGVTSGLWTFDKSGYEAYNSVVFNNVVLSSVPGALTDGISLIGTKDSSVFNNVIVGSKYGLQTRKGGDLPSGWTWEPKVLNGRFMNNIVYGTTIAATHFDDIESGLVGDYNLYYQTPGVPQEPHSLSADPMFVDYLSDWHLKAGSPALDRGSLITALDVTGSPITIGYDYAGRERLDPWDIGIYELYPTISTPTPSIAPSPVATPTLVPTPSPTVKATTAPSPTPTNQKINNGRKKTR